MNHNKKRYLKNLRKANERFRKGLDATKFLQRKYRYWHRLYRVRKWDLM